MKFTINRVRLAFPKLFTPEAFSDGDTPMFGGAFIMEPTHPQMKELKKAMLAVAKEKWGAKADVVYKTLEDNDKLALRDGDKKPDLDGYPGNYFVNASNSKRPTVLNRDKSPLAEEDGVIYAGCYVNVVVDLWPQDNKYGKRINAKLLGVQFVADGESFASGSVASADDFDDISDGADDDLS